MDGVCKITFYLRVYKGNLMIKNLHLDDHFFFLNCIKAARKSALWKQLLCCMGKDWEQANLQNFDMKRK